VSRIIEAVRQRRNARRWQRWSENDPLDDLAHRSRVGLGVAAGLFVLFVAALVLALVPR
jgi:uncharacterized protein (DUF2062 family)